MAKKQHEFFEYVGAILKKKIANLMISSDTLLFEIRNTLSRAANPETQASSQRFYKQGEPPLLFGVKNAEVTSIAKKILKSIKTLPKENIWKLCDSLWKSGYCEEAIVACTFSESLRKQYTGDDFYIFEFWVKNFEKNGSHCDTFCIHTVGTFLMMHPDYLSQMKKWAEKNHRWTKSAAAVSLIIPARKGLFLKEVIQIADILLEDADDMVQKGYGWLLKTACQTHLQSIYEYILSKKELMPRTAFRYAIEKNASRNESRSHEKINEKGKYFFWM